MNPRARHQLEVFRHSTVEDDSLGRVVFVLETPCVADAEKPLFVERLSGEFFLFVVAGRDIRPPHADFELVAVGHQL